MDKSWKCKHAAAEQLQNQERRRGLKMLAKGSRPRIDWVSARIRLLVRYEKNAMYSREREREQAQGRDEWDKKKGGRRRQSSTRHPYVS